MKYRFEAVRIIQINNVAMSEESNMSPCRTCETSVDFDTSPILQARSMARSGTNGTPLDSATPMV